MDLKRIFVKNYFNMWKTIYTGRNTAQKNMEIDETLLNTLDPSGDPILHLYDWQGQSATYGYFLDPSKYMKKVQGIDLARRPTGGGIVFHLWDLAFSVLIPAGHKCYSKDTLNNYKLINDAVLIAIEEFAAKKCDLLAYEPKEGSGADQFCYGKATKYDVMYQGKKVAGSAQRLKKNGFLHQGSISLAYPDEAFLRDLLSEDVVKTIVSNTVAFIPATEIDNGRKEMVKHLQKTLFAL